MWGFVGFVALALGWAIIIYGLWRNQRAAKGSDLVDDTNFGPRIGAIVEVTLHPDRAFMWWQVAPADWRPGPDMVKGVNYIIVMPAPTVRDYLASNYLVKVFPKMDKDSSEINGIRPDDGRVT